MKYDKRLEWKGLYEPFLSLLITSVQVNINFFPSYFIDIILIKIAELKFYAFLT